jgi:hypothetical protein
MLFSLIAYLMVGLQLTAGHLFAFCLSASSRDPAKNCLYCALLRIVRR